jgi:hypothetical protein
MACWAATDGAHLNHGGPPFFPSGPTSAKVEIGLGAQYFAIPHSHAYVNDNYMVVSNIAQKCI